MKIVFLGTGSASPTLRRNVSAMGVRFLQQGNWWLFDCGEGTQHRLLRSPLTLARMDRIFLTHLDGDHCFGLPGLLLSRALQDVDLPLDVYGFRPLQDWLEATFKATGSRTGYDLIVHPVREGLVCETKTLRVECQFLRHRGPTAAYAIIEAPHEGHFKVDKAKELGVPSGPLYGRLKRGETITLDDGRRVDGKELVEPARPGRKITVVGDIAHDQVAMPLAEGSDVLVHEATFLNELDGDLARKTGHSTAADAGRTARLAGAKTLILTHISPRYDAKDTPGSIADLQAEAQREHPDGEVLVAQDLMEFDLPTPE